MPRRIPLIVGVAIPCAIALVAWTAGPTRRGPGIEAVPHLTRGALERFPSDDAFRTYLTWLARVRDDHRSLRPVGGGTPHPPMQPVLPSGLPERSPTTFAEDVSHTSYAGRRAGEGDWIVRRDDVLLVALGGQLHSVRLGEDRLTHISSVDLSRLETADSDARPSIFITDDGSVLVVTADEAARRIEITRSSLADDGSLTQPTTRHLPLGGAEVTRNVDARLVDRQLVLYAPTRFYLEHLGVAFLPPHALSADDAPDPMSSPRLRPDLPTLDVVGGGAGSRVLGPQDVFAPLQLTAEPVLHLVLRCSIATELRCLGRGVIGPRARVTHIGTDATYLWVNDSFGAPDPPYGAAPLVYRVPHDRNVAPGVVIGRGHPCGATCLEERDGVLEALVVEKDDPPTLTLARYPASAFAPTPNAVPDGHRNIPNTHSPPIAHFVHDRWVYAGRWSVPEPDNPVFILDEGGATRRVPTALAVERFEHLGSAGVVVADTTRQGLALSLIAAADDAPLATTVVLPDPRDEGRYVTGIDGEGSIVGVALASSDAVRGRPRVSFVAFDSAAPRAVGNVEGSASTGGRDVENRARPIFELGRLFALLGRELVEAEVVGGALVERRRVRLEATP